MSKQLLKLTGVNFDTIKTTIKNINYGTIHKKK